MLESYVTPLLMSYVNKYIKNLKPTDLQLSLWGGDVVLSKLDLKLDVLEQVMNVTSFLFNFFFYKTKTEAYFISIFSGILQEEVCRRTVKFPSSA